MTKFGYKELLEYEKTCTDQKVLAIIKIAKQKNRTSVKWFNYSKKLEEQIKDLHDEIEELENPIILPETWEEDDEDYIDPDAHWAHWEPR